MKAKILATRTVSVNTHRGTCRVAILDGDGVHEAFAGDVFTVDGRARLKLARPGWFPMAQVTRLQTGVDLEDLVGREATRR